MKIIATFIFIFLFANGCASPSVNSDTDRYLWDIATKNVSQGNYDVAWSTLIRIPESYIEKNKNYIIQHPEIYTAAKKSFKPSVLKEKKKKGYSDHHFRKSLALYKKIASPHEYNVAKKNIVGVFVNVKPSKTSQSSSSVPSRYSSRNYKNITPRRTTIMCNDGTRSPTCYTCRRGCCSHHGGCR